MKRRARRGLYAARDLAAGQATGEADMLVVRPEGDAGQALIRLTRPAR